ncbi:hypothetical protein KCV01_g23232, partial [Aureobasidium melanogenum]
MRAAGVPARVVTGYQGGYWNGRANYLLVRRSDAHAWSEVWLEGRGWVRVDPTAAVRPERVQLGAAASAIGQREGWLDASWIREMRNRWDVVNQWWNRGVIGFDSLRQQGMLQPFGVDHADVTDLAVVLAIGCSLLVSIALGWAIFQRREGDALDAWMRRLERKLARAGVARRTSEGPKHFLARAARALPAQRNALERLCELYLRSRYAHDEPPPESIRAFGHAFNEVTTTNAQQGGAPGAKVRWGGEIIKTEPGPQQTCFFVLSEPLDSEARPTSNKQETQGRFVACRDGFYDPEVFVRGREITVTGTLRGAVTQKVGDFDYAYPRVEADVVYLWPKRVPVNRYPPGFYDPFWGPGFGPGWGPYYGPWGDPF